MKHVLNNKHTQNFGGKLSWKRTLGGECGWDVRWILEMVINEVAN
jgi:hypothetical protein